MIQRYNAIVLPLTCMGAGAGAVTGAMCCECSERPMLNERVGSAALLAILWGASASVSPVMMPFQMLAKLEHDRRGKAYDMFKMYKGQKHAACCTKP